MVHEPFSQYGLDLIKEVSKTRSVGDMQKKKKVNQETVRYIGR